MKAGLEHTLMPGKLACLGLSLVFSLLVAWVSAGPVLAENDYAAIAYSPRDGVIGLASNTQNRDDAAAKALEKCKASGKDCRSAVWVRDGWAALATSSHGPWGSGWSTGKAGAHHEAVAVCQKYGGKDCKVIALVRSGGEEQINLQGLKPPVEPPRQSVVEALIGLLIDLLNR